MGDRRKPVAHSLMEDGGPQSRPEGMGDDERTPDDPELEETEEPAGDDEDGDVEAHSRPLPPPRPMNGL